MKAKTQYRILMTGLILCYLFFAPSLAAKSVYLHSGESSLVWKVKPQVEVKDVSSMMKVGYQTVDWVEAVVPGTVFTAYVEAGIEKDPNFGDNIHKVDRSKYDQSFWYRTEFRVPDEFTRERTWLNFNGVNRKATIYMNGTLLGVLDGFMDRGRFDISGLVNRTKVNTLAILVDIPKTPLANQGSPNYLSSGGWDWMPYVPGLNSGITDKVWLSNTGDLTIVDPWIRTEVPSLARADISLAVEINNSAFESKKATVRGVIQPGNIVFSKEIVLPPDRKTELAFDKRYFPQLSVNSPKLWWPNGYGDPNLYTCDLSVSVDGELSEAHTITFGIKKYAYSTEGGVLRLFINETPVFVKGANWGMSEYMLRCRGEEYDLKVRLHKEMNFNMIRNWLGSTTDNEFYEACDKYGLMVWDDFWINSNPNVPYNLTVFNHNMIEKIKRVRNHPSVAVWCGDNEGFPQPPLLGWMIENIKTFDGNDRYFQANSNTGNLSGSGPWGAYDSRYYFTPYPNAIGGTKGWGMRTEIGTAVVPNLESLKRFIPADKLWPRDKEMWNLHYFGPNAFNAAPDRYDEMLEQNYGKAESIEDYTRKAQFVNFESNRAMYEGWLDRMWEDASGIMTWMGQSAYPSMVWQTYDYYYDLTGAYFGTKVACEPLHILWNPVNDAVKIANSSAADQENLTAEVAVYNLNGKRVDAYSKSVIVNSPSNSTVNCFTIDFNKERKVVSTGKKAIASSSTFGDPSVVTDGNTDTRWSSLSLDNEWIYIDLEEEQLVEGVRLNWESAYGKSFKIQTSTDGQRWTDRYVQTDGLGGLEEIFFGGEVKARYVRMFGFQRGSWYGYSLYNFDVLSGTQSGAGLDDVHFIRLSLKDANGQVLSENTYWRGNNRKDYTALNSLPVSKLKVSSGLKKKNGNATIVAQITNPSSAKGVAFGVHVQLLNKETGERVLPIVMNTNYFTLIPGETKDVVITFDEKLLPQEGYRLSAKAYN